MRTKMKAGVAGAVLGVGALALLVPAVANGNARTAIGSGRAAAAVARPFVAQLTGANEVPGPGDTDGTGAAAITINPVTGEVCTDLRAAAITTAVAAHIHRGAAGVAGPVVAPLTPPNPTSAACQTIDVALATEIAGNPAGFYVNVHTGDFPNGAIRGQLAASTSTTGDTRLLAEPVRAYDSREVPEGKIQKDTTRTISLATGVNLAGVSTLAVPPGATGAVLQITVTDAENAGFLKVYSNALAGAPATSAINWFSTGAIVAVNQPVAIDAEAKIKVTAGVNATHFVIDVVGFVY